MKYTLLSILIAFVVAMGLPVHAHDLSVSTPAFESVAAPSPGVASLTSLEVAEVNSQFQAMQITEAIQEYTDYAGIYGANLRSTYHGAALLYAAPAQFDVLGRRIVPPD